MKEYKGVWFYKVILDGNNITIHEVRTINCTLQDIHAVEMKKVNWEGRGRFNITVRRSLRGSQLVKAQLVFKRHQKEDFEELYKILTDAIQKNNERVEPIVNQSVESFKCYSVDCPGCGATTNVIKETQTCSYCGRIL